MTRRKDRVLNTRIPEELDREIRQQAQRLDVSVSELVRDALGRTVHLVGNLSGNVEHLINDVADDVAYLKGVGAPARRARSSITAELARDVVGWQEIKVQRSARCPIMQRTLNVGEVAHLGIRLDGRPLLVVSPEGLEHFVNPQPTFVSIVVQRAMSCARSGATMQQGERAWYDPAQSPPRFVCDAEYQRMCALDEAAE